MGRNATPSGAQFREGKGGLLERNNASGDLAVVELRGQSEGRATRTRVVTQLHVDRYFQAGKLSERQWQAADELRKCFFRARFDGIRTTNLQGSGGGGRGPELSADQLKARDAYTKAIRAVGPIGESVLYWIVVQNYSAKEYAGREELARDDGMGILRVALNALARHYGLS